MNTPAYTITRLTPGHAAQWQTLRVRSVRDFPLGFLTTEAEAAATPLTQIENRFKLGNDWGVFQGGALVGFCNCRQHTFDRTKHRAEIGPFFIAADHHGTGAATALMTTVVEHARTGGIQQLELYVDSGNHRAIRFYERMGFTFAATLPNTVTIDGQSYDDHLYIRTLPP